MALLIMTNAVFVLGMLNNHQRKREACVILFLIWFFLDMRDYMQGALEICYCYFQVTEIKRKTNTFDTEENNCNHLFTSVTM